MDPPPPTPSTKTLKVMLRNFKLMKKHKHLIFTTEEILSNRPLLIDEANEIVRGEPVDEDDDEDEEFEIGQTHRTKLYQDLRTDFRKLYEKRVDKKFSSFEKKNRKK